MRPARNSSDEPHAGADSLRDGRLSVMSGSAQAASRGQSVVHRCSSCLDPAGIIQKNIWRVIVTVRESICLHVCSGTAE